jgi:hypothetical protein
MVSGERCIRKRNQLNPKPKDDQYRCPYLCAEMLKEGGTTAGALRGAVIVGTKRALDQSSYLL